MKLRKTSTKEGAVRLSSSPRDNQKDDLSYEQKVYYKFRTLADFLGGVGIILCFGIVWVIGLFVCFLWGEAKEVISPTENVKHEQYEKDLDDREKAGKVHNPRVIRRANNSGNSYHDSGKDANHRILRKEGVEESIPVNLVEFFHVHSLNFQPNVERVHHYQRERTSITG